MLQERNFRSSIFTSPWFIFPHHTCFATYVFVINIYLLFFILKLLYKWCIVHLYFYNLFLSVNIFQMLAIFICIDLVYTLSLQLSISLYRYITNTLLIPLCIYILLTSYSNTSSFHSFTGIFLGMYLEIMFYWIIFTYLILYWDFHQFSSLWTMIGI